MQVTYMLPEGEPRCSPQHICLRKVDCLRYRCIKPGVPLRDYTCGADGLKREGECGDFLALPSNRDAP
jgi:hypothetical protein